MIPIREADGRLIHCPDCGEPSMVKRTYPPIMYGPIPATYGRHREWYEVACPKDGPRIYGASQLVDVVAPWLEQK